MLAKVKWINQKESSISDSDFTMTHLPNSIKRDHMPKLGCQQCIQDSKAESAHTWLDKLFQNWKYERAV